MLPSSSDIEAVQEPLDIDLSSSGAVLIDVRRRFKDLSNITKRIALGGVERLTSPSRSRRASGSAPPGRQSSMRDDADWNNYVEESTNVWARKSTMESPAASEAGRSSRAHQDDDDDEEEEERPSRYTFFPHRQSSVGEVHEESGEE